MSGLKPIGSEKLQGMDKLRRIMEIARFNENIPERVNETAKSEYNITLADGNTYEIVRERQGYIIKSYISESENGYMEPIRERKYFSSYSQALKRLNLMAKELNSLHENEEEISLLGEQKKKFILKQNKKKGTTPPPVDTPAPAPTLPEIPPPDLGGTGGDIPPPVDADMGADMPSPVDADMGGDMPAPVDADMGGDMPAPVDADMGGDMGGDMPPPVDADMGGDMGGDMPPPSDEDGGDEISKPKNKGISDFKRIQILVGKLSQKIRSYEESEDLSAKDIKYIINSILSAINVEVLDEDDIEQIISKLEGTEEDEGGDFEEENSTENDTSVDQGVEVSAPTPPEGEIGEEYNTYGEAFNDYLGSAYANAMSDELEEDYDVNDTEDGFQNFRKKYEKRNSFSQSDSFNGPYFDDSESDMELRRKLRQRPSNSFYHMNHGTYNESKIDKILSGYFSINESEVDQKYRKYASNEFQIGSVKDFLMENPQAIFMGKSTKGNLIFKNKNKQIKITESGRII